MMRAAIHVQHRRDRGEFPRAMHEALVGGKAGVFFLRGGGHARDCINMDATSVSAVPNGRHDMDQKPKRYRV